MHKTSFWTFLAAGVTTLALCSCAAPLQSAKIRDVIADTDAYVAGLDTISPTTLSKLPPGEAPVTFRRMELHYNILELRTPTVGGVTSRPTLTLKRVITPAIAPGTVRATDVWSTNDIPFRYNFRVAYRDLLSLKWQYAFVNKTNAELPYEIKFVDRLDTIVNASAEPARASYASGVVGQQTVRLGQYACTFGSTKPARQLHAELAGDYVELSCNFFGANGQITNRNKFAYLQSYGVCLLLEARESEAEMFLKLDSVKVDGGPTPKPQPSTESANPATVTVAARSGGT